ncbi:MAG TPA: hypothetical protein VFN31_02580 [Candidatus Saccharimonadales bacterium]|nr:hypothetical protein [Candidatus Saccharimonadales bacterium]
MDINPSIPENLADTLNRFISLNRTVLKLTGVELIAREVWATSEPLASNLIDYVLDKALQATIPDQFYPGTFNPEAD